MLHEYNFYNEYDKDITEREGEKQKLGNNIFSTLPFLRP